SSFGSGVVGTSAAGGSGVATVSGGVSVASTSGVSTSTCSSSRKSIRGSSMCHLLLHRPCAVVASRPNPWASVAAPCGQRSGNKKAARGRLSRRLNQCLRGSDRHHVLGNHMPLAVVGQQVNGRAGER